MILCVRAECALEKRKMIEGIRQMKKEFVAAIVASDVAALPSNRWNNLAFNIKKGLNQ